MREREMRRAVAVGIALVAIVVVLVASVVVYDAKRAGQVAEGVSVAGVDIEGLGEQDARRAVRRHLAPRLAARAVVSHAGRRFVLKSRAARVVLDDQATVDLAVRRSRTGNPI